MYKSIPDSTRYRQKKIAGKSGDSGDEMMNDDSTKDDSDLQNSWAFLTPTSSRFPRTTTVMGAGTSTTMTPIEEDEAHDRATNPFLIDDQSSPTFVYSYVSILFFWRTTFTNMCVCVIVLCVIVDKLFKLCMQLFYLDFKKQ